MPGRARRTLTKVSAIRSRYEEIADLLWKLMPELHKSRPVLSYPLCYKWHVTIEAMQTLRQALAELEQEYEGKVAKAGEAAPIETAPFNTGGLKQAAAWQ